ncbi:hypothetical protein ANRL1_00563 [Anaerolineae bacterium]|nr:hypothetical protein ANRL1_00563 [Anaerolineae bacterium]
MKLATMMTFKSVVCILTGVIFLIFPGQWLWLLRTDLDLSGTFMARLFAATFLMVGLFMWMAREVADPSVRRAIILSVFIGDGIAFIVSLIAQLSGVTNLLGWGIVIVYLLLTLGFGYLQFAKPSAA